MLGRLLRAGGVHRGDARDALGGRLARVDDDEGEDLALEHAQLGRGLLRQHQDRTVGRAAHQAVEERHLAVVVVEGRCEDDPHVALVERLGRAAQHRAEVRVGDERQRQPDHPRPPAREPAGTAVRAEAVSRTTWRTDSRVSGATSGRSLRTRETVAIETPARSAMSRIVARPRKRCSGLRSAWAMRDLP